MKEIRAYIQPFMLRKVTDALHRIHIHGMSVSEIKGFGKEKDEAYPHHSKDHVSEFVPKARIEIICTDEDVEKIVGIIKNGAHTGRKGDGKITIVNVEEVISIRTGESGNQVV